VKAKDNAQALAEGHVYGNKAVLNIRTECEVLYLRAWNQAFMPTELKTKLGIAAEAPAGTTEPAAQPAAGTDAAAQPAAGAAGAAAPAAGTTPPPP